MRKQTLLPLLPLFILLALLVACQPQSGEQSGEDESTRGMDAPSEITLKKLEGSPAFPEALLSLTGEPSMGEDGSYEFAFEVGNYELGAQTEQPMNLANSGKGQHIHFIVDNGPYAAHYEPEFSTDQLSQPGNHVVLAFLSRSFHESVKNMEEPTSYFIGQYQTGDGDYEEADFTAPHLFYSRPKGTYEGEATENLLLDFFLLNADLGPDGYQVRATINGQEFMLTDWAPYVINGLPMGEVSVKLELLDAEGNAVPGPFNVVERSVTLKAAEQETTGGGY
jgi:hypothetical protein